MKRKLIFIGAICTCFLFVMAIAASLDGKWKGDFTTPNGDQVEAVYNFKVDGNVLTGTAESPRGAVSIDDGKVSGDKFSFSVTVDGNPYPHTGKFYEDSCGVDIDFGSGEIVHETLVRDTDK
ncbi:MAG: glycoside hydrolase [Bacteroidota bacterium]|nr:glycoside hydrolase [Bacteroidota bacterium]